ncbi:MAG: YcaO-related McrA-glycine thioamidation protein [Methanobrevibacter sp.]|uniref:YcaO-related McrA-glycine thioamidation protein n=1 Tax=Methanobrevibacter sp. TaxID=66852 RepID=UPI0026DF1CE8|nr:YcaO-related McrA-glycine thioamidation protein [Methanobrevibacter sp.]MDO5848942.1 YcaO-related McrA-glycine thioamidation protein [Methanobrevibacter sp.]
MLNDEKIEFFEGTQRVTTPEKTIEKYEPMLRTAGITRITEITHLDRIGIPVFSAIRPTSQDGGVSVYAGKGIGVNQAKASAIMEGFERYSAERQGNEEIVVANMNDLEGNYIDPKTLNLPQETKNYSNFEIEWSTAFDLVTEKEFYVPSNAIYHPYIPENNCLALFKGHTNGLASGNVVEEAILHSIFEVIERDAWSIYELTRKNSRQINLETVKSDLINDLLEKFSKNDIEIRLFDLTADIKVPTILASADDTLLKDAGLLSIGIGTHLDPEIAVLRALTEVAQSRATQIQGAREDTVRADIVRKVGYEKTKKKYKHYFNDKESKIDFSEIPNKSTGSLKDDIDIVIKELKANGIENVLYKDITRPEIGVNVVRVVIPTMEMYSVDKGRVGDRCLKI